jgi:hypothetical protein
MVLELGFDLATCTPNVQHVVVLCTLAHHYSQSVRNLYIPLPYVSLANFHPFCSVLPYSECVRVLWREDVLLVLLFIRR